MSTLSVATIEKLIERSRILAFYGTEDFRILVLDNAHYQTLMLNGWVQSIQNKKKPEQLALAHQEIMLYPLAQLPSQARVLELGLGGGSAMAYATHHRPDLHWLCIEHSAHVISTYIEHFAPTPLKPEHTILLAQAQEWLEQPHEQTFDLILCDIFDSISAHLLPALVHHLTPQGQVVINWLPNLHNDQTHSQEIEDFAQQHHYRWRTEKVAGFRNLIYFLSKP